MMIKVQVPCARLCAPIRGHQVLGGIRTLAHSHSHSQPLQRFAVRKNIVFKSDSSASSAVCSSTVKELTPLTQSPTGNPLARLYVALLPGDQSF